MIRVQKEGFDPGDELNRFTSGRSDKGAVVSFTGLVRDYASDDRVQALELDHYPGFTEKEIGKIAGQAKTKWPDIELFICHRYGRMEPGEPIVQVITAAPHRQAAFEAATFLMDYLKTGAPFWKKEIREQGSEWIEPKASDYAARKTWETL